MNYLKYLALLSFIIALSCASTSQFPPKLPSEEPTKEEIAQNRAEEYFIRARDFDRRGLSQMAYNFYELAYMMDSTSEVLRSIYLNTLLFLKKYDKAVLLIRRGQKNSELSDENRRLLYSIYLAEKEYIKAAHVLKTVDQKALTDDCRIGSAYQKAELVDSAIAYYRFCFSSDTADVSLGLKIAYLLTKEHRFNEAEGMYLRLEKYAENKNIILNSLGILKILSGDTTAAEELFKTVILTDSLNTQANSYLADIESYRGNYNSAIRYCENIKDSTYLNTMYYTRNLAIYYYKIKNYKKAEELFKKLIELDMDNSENHFFLALVFTLEGKLELAELEYRKIIAFDQGKKESWMNLFYFFFRNKEFSKALELADEYLKTSSADTSFAHMFRGDAYARMKQYDSSVAEFKNALKFDSTSTAIMFSLAASFERCGMIDSAEKYFSKVLSLKPENTAAANYLGYMWVDRGIKLDSAEILIKKAVASDSENGAYLDSYGWLLFKKGKYSEAKDYLEKAVGFLDDEEDNAVIYEHLGDVWLKLNNPKKSLKMYKKSLDFHSDNFDELKKKILKVKGAVSDQAGTR